MKGAPLPLVLRADATDSIGAGHAMRLLTLGAAWQRSEGTVTCWGTYEIPFVLERMRDLGISGTERTPPLGGAVLVVDSYDPRVREQCATLQGDIRLRVLVDDVGGPVPPGYSVVWHPNAAGAAGMYAGFPGTVVSGEGALPIRDVGRWKPGRDRGIGVLLGGGRPPSALVAALADLGRRDGLAMAGAGEWVPDGWERVPSRNPWPRLVELDVLVTAAGSTVWEAASAGVPAVVVKIADNQQGIASWAGAHGAAVVDALRREDAGTLEDELRTAMTDARPLPPLRSGIQNIIREIRSRAE